MRKIIPSSRKTISRVLPASRRVLLTVAGIVLAIPLGAVKGPDTRVIADSAAIRIMPLGDSVTSGSYGAGNNGTGGFRNGVWQRLVSSGSNVDFVGSVSGPAAAGVDPDHEGHPGWTFQSLSSSIDGWLARYNPQVVTLGGDLNNVIAGETPQQTAAALQNLLTRIFAYNPDTAIVFFSTAPVRNPNDYHISDKQVRDMNAAEKPVIDTFVNQGKRITYVDVYNSAGFNPSSDVSPDGLHPNDGGYGKIAQALYPAVQAAVDRVATSPLPTPAPDRFVAGINLGGGIVTMDGHQWWSQGQASSNGFQITGASIWSTTTAHPFPLSPSADAATAVMLQSGVYRSGAPSGQGFSMSQPLVNGTYDIYLWTLENFQDNYRSMNIRVEGTQVATGIGAQPKGSWRKYGPYRTTVQDGVLAIDVLNAKSTSSDPWVTGLAIYAVSGSAQPTSTPSATTTPSSTPTPSSTSTPASTPTPAGTATPGPAGTLMKGINLAGNAAKVGDNQWLSQSQAAAAGLNVAGAAPWSTTAYPFSLNPPADAGTTAMLQSGYYRAGAPTGQGFTVTQQVTNGTYDVYLWTIENYADKYRSMTVKLEGVQVATGIGEQPKGSWHAYGPYRATVQDGVLTVDVLNAKPYASDPWITGLAIYNAGGTSSSTPTPTATPSGTPTPTPTHTPTPTPTVGAEGKFVKGINLSGDATTIDGNQWLSQGQASASGFSVVNGAGWSIGGAYPFTLTPSADSGTAAMLRSGFYRSGAPTGQGFTMSQTVPNGTYDVYLWTIENYADKYRSMTIKVEGTQVATGIGEQPRGSWHKYGPYRATVQDGALTVDVLNAKTYPSDPWISGLALYGASGSAQPASSAQLP